MGDGFPQVGDIIHAAGQAPLFGRWLAVSLAASTISVAFHLLADAMAGYVLAKRRFRGRTAWWPLVPGTALVIVGLLENTSGWAAVGSPGWPLFLIIIGLIIVAVALWRRGASR